MAKSTAALRIAVVWLLTAVLSVHAFDVEDASIERRWRALLVNCSTASAQHLQLKRIDTASVADASAVFDAIELTRARRSQWLHDIGEWHLLLGGNSTRAEVFLRASADAGNARAQFLVGALVATATHSSTAESALFYKFSSREGSMQASMALGYRHLIGYGAVQSCETALRHYKAVADDVMRHGHALPNPTLPIQVFTMPPPARLSDDQTKLPQLDREELQRVEYLRQRATTSLNTELLVRTASLILYSDLYQRPTQHHQHAQKEAVHLLQRAAGLGSSSAMALLGHVHAYGLAGVSTDVFGAIELYQDAMNSSSTRNDFSHGRSEAANGLGLLYLHGNGGVSVDIERAMTYFQLASRSGHAEGVFQTATVMANVNPSKSIEYLEASARVGHVGALFKLARMKKKQRFAGSTGSPSSCEAAVQLYKQIAEYNDYGRSLLAHAAEAFMGARYDVALRLYLVAAELGYEVAEHNALWLLERYPFTSLHDGVAETRYTRLVQRSVAQSSVDGIVRVGDLEYWKGNYRRAMQHYLRAIEQDPTHSKALYSAAYMCEHGLGTVTSGRNLLRARWYFEQAQLHEPLLSYVMPALLFKIDVELAFDRLSEWTKNVLNLVSGIFAHLYTSSSESPDGIIVFDAATKVPSPSDEHVVRFEPAMEFNGQSSSVTVKVNLPLDLDGLTLDTWLLIQQPSDIRPDAPCQVLLEWQDTLRIELVAHKDASSWQLRVLAFGSSSSSYKSALTLTEAAISAQKWHHIVLVVDAQQSKVELFVDGRSVDLGNLLLVIPRHATGQLVSIGQPSFPQKVEKFDGKLLAFRVWKTASSSMSLHNHDRGDHDLWIELAFESSPSVDTATGRESGHSELVERRQPESSEVVATEIHVCMVQFPPH